MSSNLLEFTFSSYSTWRDFCCCCYFMVFWWKMSRVGKSSATLRVSEIFKEQGGHALKSELKLFSLLNALHSLGSGLFYLVFEVLLSFKLNSSWSVTNLLEKLGFFKRNIETRAFPWEYGLVFLYFSSPQSTGVSASASVLPMNTQYWSPLAWTGWIFSQSKGLSRDPTSPS